MNLNKELEQRKEDLKVANEKIEDLERKANEKKAFKIEDIKDNDKMVKFLYRVAELFDFPMAFEIKG